MSLSITVAQVVASLADATPLEGATRLLSHVAHSASSVGDDLALRASTFAALADVIECAQRAHEADPLNAENIVPQLCDLLKQHAADLREQVSELGDLGNALAFVRGVSADAGGRV